MYAARDRLEVVVVGGGQSGLAMRGIRRRGVELHPRAVAAEGSTVTFTDGGTLDVAAVIWATGYRSDYSWLDVPVFDERGVPVHRRGVTESSGLYFLGLTWQYTRGSALLGWVKDDAEYLAQRIDELNLAPPEQSSESREATQAATTSKA